MHIKGSISRGGGDPEEGEGDSGPVQVYAYQGVHIKGLTLYFFRMQRRQSTSKASDTNPVVEGSAMEVKPAVSLTNEKQQEAATSSSSGSTAGKRLARAAAAATASTASTASTCSTC
jgi:hypothetical protein